MEKTKIKVETFKESTGKFYLCEEFETDTNCTEIEKINKEAVKLHPYITGFNYTLEVSKKVEHGNAWNKYLYVKPIDIPF